MVAGRVLLAGDCAHLVAPFGARGLNSGVQDAENAAWKIAFMLRGWGGAGLIESYHAERHAAAVENLQVTGETMRFLVPQDAVGRHRRRGGRRREHGPEHGRRGGGGAWWALGGVTAAPLSVYLLGRIDPTGAVCAALGAADGEVWLVRPDGHCAAVMSIEDLSGVTAALRRTVGCPDGR